jgi:hypothetical protein
MMRAGDAAGERGGPGVSKIRPDPGSRMEPAARWASRNGAHRSHRQHLIELGGGDVLQRLEMAQPVVADQHSTSTRAQRFGGRLDELTGGLQAAQVGAARGRRAAGRGDLRRQCLGGLAVGGLAEPRHGSAGGRPACQRLPDAAARAGDQRDPSAEWSVRDCGPVTPDDRSRGAWRQEGAGDEVTRPGRCAGSRRADHRIPGLPPAGLCRDDRPGRPSRPGLMPCQRSGTRAAADSSKRHCAAPGFTHSGQRRFSTHFSTRRGNAAQSRSSFSWSQ